MNILEKLAAPFPPEKIHWRVGATTKDGKKSLAFPYVDARDVQHRLDEIFGADWQCECAPGPLGTIICKIGLPVGPSDEMRWRSNGAGATGDVTDGREREMAQKGAYSDAFKRAASTWGVARYLYDTPDVWVAIDEKKRIMPAELVRLQASLPSPDVSPKKAAKPAPAKAKPMPSEWPAMMADLADAITAGPARVDETVAVHSTTVASWDADVVQKYQTAINRARAHASAAMNGSAAHA